MGAGVGAGMHRAASHVYQHAPAAARSLQHGAKEMRKEMRSNLMVRLFSCVRRGFEYLNESLAHHSSKGGRLPAQLVCTWSVVCDWVGSRALHHPSCECELCLAWSLPLKNSHMLHAESLHSVAVMQPLRMAGAQCCHFQCPG